MITINQNDPLAPLPPQQAWHGLPWITGTPDQWEAQWLEVAKRFGSPGAGTVEDERDLSRWLNLVKEIALNQLVANLGIDASHGDLQRALPVEVLGWDPILRINFVTSRADRAWHEQRGQTSPYDLAYQRHLAAVAAVPRIDPPRAEAYVVSPPQPPQWVQDVVESPLTLASERPIGRDLTVAAAAAGSDPLDALFYQLMAETGLSQGELAALLEQIAALPLDQQMLLFATAEGMEE